MYSYVSAAPQADAPLVVALHGCTQNATEYEQNSGGATNLRPPRLGEGWQMPYQLRVLEHRSIRSGDLTATNGVAGRVC